MKNNKKLTVVFAALLVLFVITRFVNVSKNQETFKTVSLRDISGRTGPEEEWGGGTIGDRTSFENLVARIEEDVARIKSDVEERKEKYEESYKEIKKEKNETKETKEEKTTKSSGEATANSSGDAKSATDSTAKTAENTSETTTKAPALGETQYGRDYDAASEFFTLLNEYRVANGKKAVETGDFMNEYAMQRANDLVTNYSHERPADRNPLNGCPMITTQWSKYYAYSFASECINYGFRMTPHDCLYGYNYNIGFDNSPGHHDALLSSYPTHAGIGVVRSGNNVYYAVVMYKYEG